MPLQNGIMKSSEPSEEGAPALRLRLLCPQAVVPALIGKVGRERQEGRAVRHPQRTTRRRRGV